MCNSIYEVFENFIQFVAEGLWKGLTEACKEVSGALAIPDLEHGVFNFVFGFGGEACYTEDVVWAYWVHCSDAEGDEFGGPDFSV